MTINHSERRVLITGAAGPLEGAIAQAFKAQGARVVEGTWAPGASPPGIGHYQTVVKDAIAQLGGLDILVTCTGIEGTTLIENATLEQWEIAFRPAKAAFFLTQAAMPALTQSRGAIVNVTSVLGQMGARAGLAIPATAMATVVQQTRMLALRLGKDGVRVNCVCHGYMSELEGTGLPQPSVSAPATAPVAENIPLGRLAKPEDVIGPVLFLASPLAGFMNGAIVAADGGTFSGS